MDNKDIKKIEQYAARKGYIVERARITADRIYNIDIKKAAAGAGFLNEASISCSELSGFKRELALVNKGIRKKRQGYAKVLRLKNEKTRREIESFEKHSKRARNIRRKYTGFFELALTQIIEAFENKTSMCADFFPVLTEHYLSAYNRILPYNHGVSRKANLLELDRAYKKAAKKLYKYIAGLIKTYRNNPANDYKNVFLFSAHSNDGLFMLDKKTRVSYRRLGNNVYQMCVKAAEYVTNFGGGYKGVAESNFFNKYISLSQPLYKEDIDYLSLRNIITLCVNKNTANQKKRKPFLLFFPALSLGFSGKNNVYASDSSGRPLKPVLPLLTLLLIMTGSTALPYDDWDFNLGFLPFGIGDRIDEGMGAIAARIVAANGNPAEAGIYEADADVDDMDKSYDNTSDADVDDMDTSYDNTSDADVGDVDTSYDNTSDADVGDVDTSYDEADADLSYDEPDTNIGGMGSNGDMSDADLGGGILNAVLGGGGANADLGGADLDNDVSNADLGGNGTGAVSGGGAMNTGGGADASPSDNTNADFSGGVKNPGINNKTPLTLAPDMRFNKNTPLGSVDKFNYPKNNPKTRVK